MDTARTGMNRKQNIYKAAVFLPIQRGDPYKIYPNKLTMGANNAQINIKPFNTWSLVYNVYVLCNAMLPRKNIQIALHGSRDVLFRTQHVNAAQYANAVVMADVTKEEVEKNATVLRVLAGRYDDVMAAIIGRTNTATDLKGAIV
eukprot:1126438_1